MAITTNNLISRQTVGSAGAASVTFSNIPQGFTDLRIDISSRSTRNTVNEGLFLTPNGATANGSRRVLIGSGSVAESYSGSDFETAFSQGGSSTASVFDNISIYLPNYASANYKTWSTDAVTENNATSAIASIRANLWSDTAAITSLVVSAQAGNFVQYSTFSLYGISSNTSTQNTSIPSATGGDVITTDGTYWYHQFLYSGTFTPLKALTADYLVVAGGGGGGGSTGGATRAGGGGGGGGYRTGSSVSLLASTNYTTTVGAGGAGGIGGSGDIGTNGSNSVFNSITSAGGGGGGDGGSAGLTGGSAGGSGRNNATTTAGNTPSTSPSQGNAGGGGAISSTAPVAAGGGGGAGAVGQTAPSTSQGGAGGTGTASSITGSSVTRGGGGGGGSTSTGGAGGTGGGGGGRSGADGNGTDGTANTGGGGGGCVSTSSSTNGGAGGSGIVIVRYAV